jgi:hypothetical protein
MMKTSKTFATASQKEYFKSRFADIVVGNQQLHQNYTIQFFDTAAKSNYVIQHLNGKSMNVIDHMSESELERYRVLKNNWQQ